MTSLCATLDLPAVGAAAWDAVVIGAGPAGALAAYHMATMGRRVLLVDKAAFPRWKVCGCCINASALATLQRAGLGQLTRDCNAAPLSTLRLAAGGRAANLALHGSVALSRRTFDAALVSRAIEAGAQFLPQCSATVQDVDEAWRTVQLRQGHEAVAARARVVLVADGLGGRALADDEQFAATSRAPGRIGVGAVLDEPAGEYEPGIIYMACGRGGYVGLVRLEDGKLEIASAMDQHIIRAAAGDVGAAAAGLLHEAGLPPLHLVGSASWRGTSSLISSRRKLAAERLFVIGDAAGYVEPFTGEGIAWALASATAVAPLANDAIEQWDAAIVQRWQKRHAQLLRSRHRACLRLSWVLRRPGLMRVGVAALKRAPWLVSPIVRRASSPLC